MSDVAVYATALIAGHGRDATAYLAERISTFEAEGLHDDAAFWRLVRSEIETRKADGAQVVTMGID